MAAAAAAAVACAPAVANAAAPRATEFRTGVSTYGGASAITTGPDGNLWALESDSSGRVLRVTRAGGVTGFTSGLSPYGTPKDIAAGADGNLWFTLQTATRIGRITPAGAVTQFSAGLTYGGYPSGITAGPDGNVWFTEAGGYGRIGRITTSGAVTGFQAGLTAFSQPRAITAGPDGNLWYTAPAGSGRIGRVTPQGVITEFTAGLTAFSSPWDITAGPDGNVWFTSRTDPGRVGRVTPQGVITEFTAGLPANDRPTGITAGPDGNLWVTFRDSEKLARVTPAGQITSFDVPGLLPDATQQEITSGPDGNLWVAAYGPPARIARVTIGATRVQTQSATSVADRSAALSGTVTPNGGAASWYFEYGPTAAYGQRTGVVPAGSGTAAVAAASTVTGLTPGTEYHFRLVATSPDGVFPGADAVFTTASVPGSPPAPEAPQLGRTVVVTPVEGTVVVTAPGGGTRPLTGGDAIPSGSTVDTTHGVVELATARRGQAAQKARFWGGRFRVEQPREEGGWTDIYLTGPPLACTPPRVTVSGFAEVGVPQGLMTESARAPRRKLWGSDHKGKYRTHGRDSVATVRGTKWLTVERCDGTFTSVTEGAVSVRDLWRKRTVLLRAGDTYLARRPRK